MMYFPISQVIAIKKQSVAGTSSHQLILTSDNAAAFSEFPNSDAAVIAITAIFSKTKNAIKSGFLKSFFGTKGFSSISGFESDILFLGSLQFRIVFNQHANTTGNRNRYNCTDKS